MGCRTAAEVDERRRKAAARQRAYAARKKAQMVTVTDLENPFKDWKTGEPIPAGAPKPVKTAPKTAAEKARIEAGFQAFMDEMRAEQGVTST